MGLRVQKIIILAPQASTGDNRLDREQKNNPSSFPRRLHQTSNSSQKRHRRRHPWNSINVEPNGSSANIYTTSPLGGRRVASTHGARIRALSCSGQFGRQATNEITLPMERMGNMLALTPRECIDLWWNWLAERRQHQSAVKFDVYEPNGWVIGEKYITHQSYFS